MGWRFYYGHYHAIDGCIAWCEKPNELSDRCFTLGLEPEIDSKILISNQDIKRSAFHEVMEAFLWKMEAIGKARVGFPSDLEEERHHIIRTLETVVFDGER